MVKLIRIEETGAYFTEDGKYKIEKGIDGWNVNEWDNRGWYAYSFTCPTLKVVRESL